MNFDIQVYEITFVPLLLLFYVFYVLNTERRIVMNPV